VWVRFGMLVFSLFLHIPPYIYILKPNTIYLTVPLPLQHLKDYNTRLVRFMSNRFSLSVYPITETHAHTIYSVYSIVKASSLTSNIILMKTKDSIC